MNLNSRAMHAHTRNRLNLAHLSDASGTITASLFGAVAGAVLALSCKQTMAGVTQEYIEQKAIVLSQKKYIVQISKPKLKEHEITPRYTVANCVDDGTSGMIHQQTPSEISVGTSSTSLTLRELLLQLR